jgi:2-oxoisovalerate dehydrogenase E1 component
MEDFPLKATDVKTKIPLETLKQAFRLMCTAKSMTELYEANKEVTAKYVHATSRGHEAVQLALGLQLLPQDFVSPYYRDDSILLGMGVTWNGRDTI